MYRYHDTTQFEKNTESIDDRLSSDVVKSDFWRFGVAVYVGSDPDVSGPEFIIDPFDEKGIEIFKSFCQQMAEHYKHLNNKP